jgi:TRAP-type C4-dicarboxylate transport system substrate-binding protein
MKRREAIKAIGAAAIVSQVGLSKPARAQVKLRYSNASNAGYLANVVMTEYWQEVSKRTNGEVQAEVFWGTLGGEQTLLNGVSLGTLDGYHGAYTGMREFDLFYTVGLFRDYEHAARVVNGPLRDKLQKAFEAKYKVRMLGLGRAGAFALQVKPKPASWSDVKSLKVRVGAIEGVVESVKAIGANPVTMAFNEVYTALQQGVVDGQVTLGTLVVTMKYYEVVKHWIRNDFGLGFDKVVLSQRAWNRIKPPHQKMMQELFFEMEEKKWYQVLKQNSEGFFKKWEEAAGPGTVVALDDAELQKLARPTAQRLADEILGPGTFKTIQATK